MRTSKFGLRAMYLMAFGTATWSGFLTYRFFLEFKAAADLNPSVVVLNTLVLLLLWFFTLTSKSNFIRENIYFILIAPLFSIYATNLYFAINTGTVMKFLPFAAVNSVLFIASERFEAFERKLKQA